MFQNVNILILINHDSFFKLIEVFTEVVSEEAPKSESSEDEFEMATEEVTTTVKTKEEIKKEGMMHHLYMHDTR